MRDIPEELASADHFTRLMATPGKGRNQIVPEPEDGPNCTQFTARSVRVYDDTGQVLADIEKSDATVSLTASRVTIGCSKYDTGGQWIGGLAALALEAGERAVTAARARNKMFVAQIRYPWLSGVQAQPKSGWTKPPTIILYVAAAANSETEFLVKLTFDKHTDVFGLGLEIAKRASEFRRAHDKELAETYGDELEAVLKLTTMPAHPTAAGGKWVTFRSRKVTDQSAAMGQIHQN